MIKIITGISLFLLFLLWPSESQGQFLNIQIDVEPSVDTVVEQQLDFGQMIAGSGLQEIPLGSPNMGVFHIRALRTQRMLISIDADPALVHANPNINASIPMEIFANYTNNGIDNFRASDALSDELEMIIVESPENNPEATWSGIYIYIYGSIDLRNVPLGTYSGNIILTVVYE
tara:strand:- start:52547 stop:53068 length:522 start_codon:yes stop_codon:yes gene_type:complete